MAISTACQWEVRDDGSDTNGGGFDPSLAGAGSDYSQQAAAQLAVTDIVAAGTTTLTSATAGFTAAMVGNCVYLQGGSGALAATWRQITAFTNSSTITVDATVAAGTGITGNVGGALLTVKLATDPANSPATPSVAGNYVFINYRTGTAHSVASSIAPTRGGDNTTGRQYAIVGYDGTAGTRNLYSRPTNRPTLKATAGVSIFTSNAHGMLVRNLIFDLDSQNFSAVIMTGNSTIVERCKQINSGSSAGNAMFHGGTGAVAAKFVECEASIASGSSVAGFNGDCMGCRANIVGTSGIGFNSGCYINSVAIGGGTGGTATGFNLGTMLFAYGCVAYNLNKGFVGSTIVRPSQFFNCIASTCNRGFDGSATAGSFSTYLRACAYYNCSTGVNSISQTVQFTGAGVGNTATISLSADPFTNAGAADFSLNNTAGGGAAVRALGWYPVGGVTTIGYPDIGAFQSQASAGGSGSMAWVSA